MNRLGTGAAKLQRVGLLLPPVIFVSCCAARAQEYCVVCARPNAVYRCVIDGAQPQGGQPLQMLCVTAMAKAGSHGSCSVTGGTVFDCNGPVRRVPWSATNAPAAAIAPQQPAAGAQADPPASPGSNSEGPPQTVVEMARRANQQTGEQMKKAGENITQGAKSVGNAVSNATKKTWDCMTSLFTRC
jgi:hypothetical protein